MPASRSPTSSAGRRGRDETKKETGGTRRGSTPQTRPQAEPMGRSDRSRSGSAAPPFEGMSNDCRRENYEAAKRDGAGSAGGRGGASSASGKRSAPEEITLQLGDWVCMKDQCYNHMYAKRTTCNRHQNVEKGYSNDAVVVTVENRGWLTKCVTERKEEIARKRSNKGRPQPPRRIQQ